MELSKKVKTALDETHIDPWRANPARVPVCGEFSQGYEQLPSHAGYMDGVALGLMVCVVGLLITPGPYHRLFQRPGQLTFPIGRRSVGGFSIYQSSRIWNLMNAP
jgi:hypothetical protein